jgi:UDP-N-acetylmuramate dehydrogenase
MTEEQPSPVLDIQQNVILAEHCRFRVGGPADYFTAVTDAASLVAALELAAGQQLRYFILAGGSNLFFDDSGFRGLVIKLVNGGWQLNEDQSLVEASAGYALGALVRELAGEDRGGLEFLANIPGSVGGALVGNAGCYGQAIADVLSTAQVYDTEERRQLGVDNAFFEFAYRHSRLKESARYIALSATLKVAARPGGEVLSEIEDELKARLDKHPHEAWCAGSYFKNPSRDNPAWRVITEAGMADASVGDARLSPRHANFLVNDGTATSAEIIALTHTIQRAVREHSGIELVPEVRYVGPTGVVELKPE